MEAHAPAADVAAERRTAAAGPVLTPISSGERIASVDVVRGIAVLGILLMNIVGFAFHAAAYADPSVAGGAAGINLWVYAINAVLVDGKMRGIFSLVFGAGVVILTSRAAERGAAADAADIHYRRMYWLLLFGAVHAYVLWWGDILYSYALLGLFLYPMRRMSPRGLIVTGVTIAVLLTGLTAAAAFRTVAMRDQAIRADAAQATRAQLTKEQLDAQKAWRDHLESVKPDAAELTRVNEAFGGSFTSALKERAGLVARFHFRPYYFPSLWDMLCMMLFGMALVPTGVLTGQRSYRFYVKMAVIAYGLGIPAHIWMVWRNVTIDFEHVTMGFIAIPYEPARIAVCFGHVAVIMLILKAGVPGRIASGLAAVGRMAFSNYILQSIVCSTIFYGYGFGLFGKLQRYQIYYVVLGCWAVNVVFSMLWLRSYRFGPLEWCWRSLTYWQRQPMRLPKAAAAEAFRGVVTL